MENFPNGVSAVRLRFLPRQAYLICYRLSCGQNNITTSEVATNQLLFQNCNGTCKSMSIL